MLNVSRNFFQICFLIYFNLIIISANLDEVSKYISFIDPNTLQIVEKDKEIIKTKSPHLRNLAGPGWVVNNACSETTNYGYSALPEKSITRLTNNDNSESYIMFAGEGYYDWNAIPAVIPLTVKWQVIPKVVTGGAMFFGMCAFSAVDPPNSCKNLADISYDIYFSGISFTYFGENCYHIDHYVNNNYWTTPRHCLSEFELKSFIFTFQIKYDGINGTDVAELKISYDGFEYYDRNNIIVRSDSTAVPNKALPNVHPCAYLFVPGTSIEIKSTNVYPPIL